jgi:HAD superfamily hydrolase (TIGR01509 family)
LVTTYTWNRRIREAAPGGRSRHTSSTMGAKATRIGGLIFDFDGLILDTEVPAFESWRQVYEDHGGVLAVDTWARVLGGSGNEIDHIAELERFAGRKLDGQAIRRRRLEHKQALIDEQDILPGVKEYIAEGKELGLRLAVVSSSPRTWVEHYLLHLGIMPDFDAVVCGADAPRSKPHPDLYLRALASLNLQSDEVIAFEDSPNGITSAQGAGVFCVAVPNAISAQMPTDHADLRLSSLAATPLSMLLRRVESAER